MPQKKVPCPECGNPKTKRAKVCRKCEAKHQMIRNKHPISDPVERFWKYVKKSDDPDGCWEWIGSRCYGGYGRFYLNGHRIRSTYFMLQLESRSVPEGDYICHHCDNPSCVRPDHLFVGTNSDNQQDAKRKGRLKRPVERRAYGLRNGAYTHPEKVLKGEMHGRAKLTEQNVRDIRKSYADGMPLTELAKLYHVACQTIEKIVNRKRWAHIT